MRKKSGKVSMVLPKDLLKELGAEVSRIRRARPGTNVSRSEVLRQIVAQHLETSKEERHLEERTYSTLIHEAAELKERGKTAMSEGGHRRARKMFLQSAAKELEALSLVEDPNEDTIRTTLIEVVVLIKSATGYAHLPEYPASRPRMEVADDKSD